MIPLWMIIYILASHWIADYILQTRRIANHKHQDILILIEHIVVYMNIMVILCLPIYFWLPGTYYGIWLFANTLLHGLVDFFTSKAVKSFWSQGKEHLTFIVMGFDQFLHLSILFASLAYLLE